MFFIGFVKKMKVVVKGGVAVDLELGNRIIVIMVIDRLSVNLLRNVFSYSV